MVNFHIAYDDDDDKLGRYFESSKTDIVEFIQSNCDSSRVWELSSEHCDITYIDTYLPQINSTNFIFTTYCHGNVDELVAGGACFVKKNKNSYLFANSLFYSMSCLAGRELASALILEGTHAFLGFKDDAKVLLEDYQQLSIECDNYALKEFILGKAIGQCFEEMKNFISDKIEYLLVQEEPLHASYLRANRDALTFEGNDQLTIEDFKVN